MRLTHYDFLGIDSQATYKEIYEKYQEASKIWHADHAGKWADPSQLGKCHLIQARLNEAYRVLTNERAAYDIKLKFPATPTDIQEDTAFKTIWKNMQIAYKKEKEKYEDSEAFSNYQQDQIERVIIQNKNLISHLQKIGNEMKSFDDVVKTSQKTKDDQILNLKKENQDLSTQVILLQREKQSTQRTLADKDKKIQEAEKTIKDQHGKISELSQENKTHNFQQELASKEMDIQEAQKTVKSMSAKISELHRENQTLAHKNSTLLKEIEILRQNQTKGIKREIPQDVPPPLKVVPQQQRSQFIPVFASAAQMPNAMDIENNNDNRKIVPQGLDTIHKIDRKVEGLEAIYQIISHDYRVPENFDVRLIFKSSDHAQAFHNKFYVFVKNKTIDSINLYYYSSFREKSEPSYTLRITPAPNSGIDLTCCANPTKQGQILLNEFEKYFTIKEGTPVKFYDSWGEQLAENEISVEFQSSPVSNRH